MIVDTSALVAVLKQEAEASAFKTAMLDSEVRVSAVTLFEFGMVVDGWGNAAASQAVELLLSQIEADVIAVDADTARLARDAYGRFGKGRHPARLNFGDCFAYALAKQSGEHLLFKGDDFSQTDVVSAV